ncbi:hypothetical protein [Cylindrospermum sp. FACHB-282]|uniref:hypothetical protein n=1 Tax=Cylindrospermum sp. FACHB-282 TaxID=2692794 RepID=UPI001687A5B7|nr:hypothetical protein [Cylindrospermum sp. FACHB-282]MBD2388719.1 hypothetical protein [Cylindrospermum sp. FACHB-282]
MSQNPLFDSGTQLSKTPELKPALGAALASLEVQLDQELTRYRRTRTRSRAVNPSRGENYINSQPQQLTDMRTTAAKTLPLLAENRITSPQGNSALGKNKTDELDDLLVPSRTAATKTQTPPPPPPPNSKTKISSSIVPTEVKTPQKENILQPENTPQAPDDYLESSEALLRSLTTEEPEIKKPSNTTSDSLLSPLGIGSILLLLVASLTLGYIVFNPKNLPQLNLANLLNSSSSPNNENTEGITSNPQPTAQAELTSIPKYPNLAAKEFPAVRDPNDLVGLKPKIQPIPKSTPNTLTVPQPMNPTTVQPLPPLNPTTVQPLPPLNPVPKATEEPLATATATPPQVNLETKPAADGFYHIVIDNQGDGALAAARQVVPDAYFSRNQKYIYLAAMKTKAEVEQRLQQLQAKGLKARIQQP